MKTPDAILSVTLAAVLWALPVAAETKQLIRNGGFEAGEQGWVLVGDFHADDRFGNPLSGRAYAYLSRPEGEAGASLFGTLEQSVSIPANASRAVLGFWYSFSSYGRNRIDTMRVTIRNAAGEPLETVAVITTHLPKGSDKYGYIEHDITGYRGETVRVHFEASTDAWGRTTFRLDEVTVMCAVEDGAAQLASREPAATAPAYASPEEAGLAAEMAKNWEEALSIYGPLLAEQPERSDLWTRVADIEAARGRPGEALVALEKAAAASPDDAELHRQRSRALAAADRPQEALAAIQTAVRLEPGNVDYLRAQALLATWAGDSELALASYESILEILDSDREAELGRARAEGWLGLVDRSAEHYRHYVEGYPEDSGALLEYARTEGWRGNFAAGLEILDRYVERFDVTEEYFADRARLLVGAQRPQAGLELVEPLLSEPVADPWIQGTYAMALARSGRPRRALEAVESLDKSYPDQAETLPVRQVVTTPLRSLVRPLVETYSDSDSVDRYRFGLEGRLRLAPSSHLSVGVFDGESRADRGSGLAAPDGAEVIATEGFWLGLEQRLGPHALLSLRGGSMAVEGREDETTYRLGLRLEPGDGVAIELSRERELYDVSPRALALGVRRDVSRGSLLWSPALRYTVNVVVSREEFSDDNRRQELILAPRRAVLRRARLNLDLGLRGWWFSFDRNPGNGYYAPTDFERYSLTANLYWKLAEQHGLGLSLSPSYLKDETMESFEFSADASLELTIGIYRAWMLVLRASATENGRAPTGAFSATGVGIVLTRRF